jgi:galactose mutarotase-like enzyme
MQWLGVDAWMLANASVQVVIIPEMGGKIVSLLDRHSGVEWLAGPGKRPFHPVEYGVVFTDQDMSGWDEMFPTIVACPYPGQGPHHGASLPDHGDAWALPWDVVQAGEGRLTISVKGRALPYRLTRTADCPEPGALRLSYTLQNLGGDPMPYLWSAHPQFTCGQDGQVVFPPEVTEVINTVDASWGWGEPETRFAWPEATALDGSKVRIDRIGPPTSKRARKFFALPDARPTWTEVLRCGSGERLRLEWDPSQVPYVGVWMEEGVFSHDSIAAPEPMTAWYDTLSVAVEKGYAPVLPAGETTAWSLTVRLGNTNQPCP